MPIHFPSGNDQPRILGFLVSSYPRCIPAPAILQPIVEARSPIDESSFFTLFCGLNYTRSLLPPMLVVTALQHVRTYARVTPLKYAQVTP